MLKKFCVLSIIVILIFSGCSKNGNGDFPDVPNETQESFWAAPEHTPALKESGGITISMRQPMTLNPLLNIDVTVDAVLKLIFEPMLIYDEQLRPVVNRKVLQSAVFASDGLSVTLTPAAGALG